MKRLCLLLLATLLCTLCACQNLQSKEGYALVVDGQLMGVMETEEEIQEELDGLKSGYCTQEDLENDAVKLDFLQTVEILPGEKAESFATPKQLTERLTQTVEEEIIYTVKEGDTFAGIAAQYQLTDKELQECNPNYDSENIQVGDPLTVRYSHPLLQVKMTKTVTYEEVIQYRIKTVYRDDKPTNYSKTVTKGVNGKKLVEAEQIYVDGVLTKTVVVKETTLQEPVTEEREVGTIR